MKTVRIIQSGLLGTRLIELKPVYNKAGNIELYDVYYNDTWLGSGRTVEICRQRFYNYIGDEDD